MLPAVKRDLQGGLRSCAFADGVRRKLKWLPFGDPAFDVVHAPIAAHLMENAEVLRELGKLTLPIWLVTFRHDAPILMPASDVTSAVGFDRDWRGSGIPGMC